MSVKVVLFLSIYALRQVQSEFKSLAETPNRTLIILILEFGNLSERDRTGYWIRELAGFAYTNREIWHLLYLLISRLSISMGQKEPLLPTA